MTAFNRNTNAQTDCQVVGDIETMEQLDHSKLADRCRKLLRGTKKQQVFIAVAGGPGSGKSTISEAVIRNLNKEREIAVVVPMDGYHIPQQELKKMAEEGKEFELDQDLEKNQERNDTQTKIRKRMSFDELMAHRGAPWTFCPDHLYQDLKRVKETGSGSFPIYCRERHDPVPDGTRVEPHHQIIFVEGNYLLCLDDPEWEPLGQLWDDRWFIEVPLDETLNRLVKRHMKNWTEQKTRTWGAGEEGARRKAESNDLKNAKCITQSSRHFANLIIRN